MLHKTRRKNPVDIIFYKRVISQEFSFVRFQNIQGWAGLWMRVDSANGALDNMENRPINGKLRFTDNLFQ